MKQQVNQGIDVLLSINGKLVGGQQGVQLNRGTTAIDITNRITGNWQEKIPGLKTWGLTCNGVYLTGSEGYDLLEKSFMENKEIDVKVTIGHISYRGKAIITDFPLSSGYSSQFKYSIKLLGNGALN